MVCVAAIRCRLTLLTLLGLFDTQVAGLSGTQAYCADFNYDFGQDMNLDPSFFANFDAGVDLTIFGDETMNGAQDTGRF